MKSSGERVGALRRCAAALCALLVIGAGAPTASLASSKRCRPVVIDPRGDATDWVVPGKPYVPQADILSASFGTTTQTIDLVWHMVTVDAHPAKEIDLVLGFDVGQGKAAKSYVVGIQHAIDADTFSIGVFDPRTQSETGTNTQITGSVDATAGTMTAHIPRSYIHAHFHTVLENVGGYAGDEVGVSAAAVGQMADQTSTNNHYRVGDARC